MTCCAVCREPIVFEGGSDRAWHPTHNPARWRRPDGSFDVLAYCRWLDDNANTGAGPRREEEA